MKVTVTQGVRVVHDGTLYQDGQSADVPKDVADQWVTNGWAVTSGPAAQRDPRGLTAPAQDPKPAKTGK
jgi:hypothetical protein